MIYPFASNISSKQELEHSYADDVGKNAVFSSSQPLHNLTPFKQATKPPIPGTLRTTPTYLHPAA